MAADIFMKLEGGKTTFEGETLSTDFPKQVEIQNLSWALSQSSSFGHGQGGSVGQVSVADISFNKKVDKTTTSFIKALTTSDHIGKVTISFCKTSDGKAKPYMTYTLTTAMVTQYSGGASTGDLINESISISCAKFEVEYFLQNDKGVLSSAGKVGYDLQKSVTT